MHKIKKFLIACPENQYTPPVLSYKAFIAYGSILLILRLLLGFFGVTASAVDSQILMRLINEERSNRNLTVLATNQSLLQAASGKAQDMIDRDYFAHIDPDGNYVWGRIKNAGYDPYRILGENLALDFSTSEGLIKAWLDSPTHRANMMHAEFLDQGLSAQYGDYQGRYTNLTASLFGALATAVKPKSEIKSSPPAPKTANPPPPTTAPAPDPKPAPMPPVQPAVKLNPPPAKPAFSALQKNMGERQLNFLSPIALSRLIFTIFGLFLLAVLLVDSAIIYRRQLQLQRSYSSYHLSTFFFIVLVSILIWWW